MLNVSNLSPTDEGHAFVSMLDSMDKYCARILTESLCIWNGDDRITVTGPIIHGEYFLGFRDGGIRAARGGILRLTFKQFMSMAQDGLFIDACESIPADHHGFDDPIRNAAASYFIQSNFMDAEYIDRTPGHGNVVAVYALDDGYPGHDYAAYVSDDGVFRFRGYFTKDEYNEMRRISDTSSEDGILPSYRDFNPEYNIDTCVDSIVNRLSCAG